ncbi:xanthine dehydrogenase family protein molybdopterin-binding subunit [soil metagenome]
MQLQAIESAVEQTTGISRRGFLVRGIGGLALGFVLPDVLRIAEAQAAPPTNETAVASWLRIGIDESVTLTIGSSEMGQGSFSGLAQILAEELMVDYSRIVTEQGGPTLANPAPVGTAINTVGSGVTRNNFWKLRDAGAAAREMLVRAAMDRFGDYDRNRYTVNNGVITYRSGISPAVPSRQLGVVPDRPIPGPHPTSMTRTLTYGQVAAAAALLPVPTNPPLVKDADFKFIGKTMPRFDIPNKVDGSAKYGLDIRLPNMVYGIVKHCPSFGGKLAVTPNKPAGMIAVVPTSVAAGTGRGTEASGNVNAVVVVGTNTWDTWQAAKQMNVSWTLPPNAASLNSAQFVADAQALLTTAAPYVSGGANPPGTLYTVEGNAPAADTAINAAPIILDNTYILPYIPHACMEVLNCTVDYVAGVKCDVYAPTQSSKTALSLVVQLTGLPESKITIHTTYLGGGLGRKAEVDFISQAVQVGMALARPVKLMWPREEDFTRDQYRPMALMRARAGLDASGNVLGWSYRNISPSILAQRGSVLGAKGDSQGYEASQALPYNLGSRVVEYVTHPSPIPVGFWRSVGASLNTFGVESMIDELAAAAGADPYQFRRNLLTDPRWIVVLDAAATLGKWNIPPAAGRARGIAIGTAFNSIVAQVVEISSVTSTSIRISNVSVVLDAYLTVNPGQVESQLVGGVVHAINATLYGRQTFVNGAAQSKNFNNSRMIRLSEMPQVSVSVIPNPATAVRATAIGGVGELGVPTFAPALANAYFKLTGTRVRTLPFFPNATMGGL